MTAKRTHSRKKTARAGIKVADLPAFDVAAYLDDEQTIAAYLPISWKRKTLPCWRQLWATSQEPVA